MPNEFPTREEYTFDSWLVFSSWYSTSSSVEKFGLSRLGQEITSQFIGGENCELVAYWVKNEPTSCPERDIYQFVDAANDYRRYNWINESGTILSLTKAELNKFGYLQYIKSIYNSDIFRSHTNIEYTLYNSNDEMVDSIQNIEFGTTFTIRFNSADSRIVFYLYSVDYMEFIKIPTPTYNAETGTYDVTIDSSGLEALRDMWISSPGEIDIDNIFPDYDPNVDYTCWALFRF